MKRFIEGESRSQQTLMPGCLEDHIGTDNSVRIIDAFVEALDLSEMGFDALAAATGRPGYHPGLLLKIYIYGYLNRIQSSRRLERETGRNVELMWLTGRLSPSVADIAALARPALTHRMALTFAARAEGATITSVIDELLPGTALEGAA